MPQGPLSNNLTVHKTKIKKKENHIKSIKAAKNNWKRTKKMLAKLAKCFPIGQF